MNILYLASIRIPNEKASGLAIMRQCEAFAKLSNQVNLLRPYRSNSIREEAFTYYGIKNNFEIVTMSSMDLHSSLGKLGFFLTRFSQMLFCLWYIFVHRKNIDIVYTRDPWMIVLPTLFGFKGKIILEVHKTYENVLSSTFVNYAMRKATLVICITEGLKIHYVHATKRTDIRVEPSGVNIEQFKDVPPQEEIRKKFGISTDKKVVGYIGKYTTMGEEKGVDDLIKAFAEVHKSKSDAHLLIVGLEPEEIPVVRAMCMKMGLGDDVVTLSELVQKDFAEYVQLADILVMNYPDTEHYRNYMSPTKLFAYMASGKIIVASDLPSVREIVDEHTVLFIQPGDHASLTGALRNGLTEKAELSTQRGNVCIEHVSQFAWEERGKRILSLLNT